MGVIDALTILGSGIGRGYRGSQELQRQIAEAKRKALIEERDLAIREQAQNAANALAAAQSRRLGVESDTGEFSLGRARAAATSEDAPVTQGGSIPFRLGGQSFTLPNRLSTLQNPQIAALLGQGSEEAFKARHPDYYMHYPPVGRGSTSFNSTPEGKALQYMQLVFGTNITPLLGEDEESYSTRVNKERNQRLQFLLNNKDTIDDLLGGGSGIPSDSTDTSGKKKKKPSGNRFQVDVK